MGLSLSADISPKRWPYPTVAVTVVIMAITLMPGRAVLDLGFSGIDLVVHLVMFGAWGFWATMDLFTTSWYRIVGFGLLLAATTEILQIAVPGRYFSWWDVLADALGVVLGVTLGRWWLKVRRTGRR
jgi:hypothetical protein